jgi:hypothetical protein
MLTQERRVALPGARADELRRISTESRLRAEREISASLGQSPIHPHELGKVLAESLDKNVVIVSENLTGKYESFRFGFREDEQMFLGNIGIGLGWGIAAATGAKPAAPDRQVVCSIGDGFGDVQRRRVLDAGTLPHSGSHLGLEQSQLSDCAPLVVQIWRTHGFFRKIRGNVSGRS